MWYENWWKETVLEKRNTFSKKIIFEILIFFSYIYKFIWKIYLFLYQKKILKSKKVDATVISFGNLTLGGSGKTPHVVKFLQDISPHQASCAVLLRGYKAKTKEKLTIVSDGKGNILAPLLSGDEGYLIAYKNKNVVVIAGKNRVTASSLAISNYGCKLIVLDDGYQYLKIEKDIEVILIDTTIDLKKYRIFPAGILREDIKNINRADAIIFTKVNFGNEENISNLRKIIYSFRPNIPIIESEYKMLHLKNIFSEKNIPLEIIKNKKVVTISGIAEPDTFEKNIKYFLPASFRSYRFPDHYFYTTNDIKNILNKVRDLNEDMVITTEKDAVKILNLNIDTDTFCPVYFAVLDIEIVKGKDVWERICKAHIVGS